MNRKAIENLKEVSVIAACALACALIAAFFLYEPWRTADYWFGNKPRIEVITPIGTLLAASAAATLAYFGYRANVRAELAVRLQKALDLIDTQKPAKSASAVALLEEVALESNRYRIPVMKTLLTLIYELDTEESGKISLSPENTLLYAGFFQHNNLLTNDTLRALSRLQRQFEGGEDGIGAHVILRMYLSGFLFNQQYFAKQVWRGGAIHDTGFDRCDFSGASISAVLGNKVRFLNCDVARLQLFFSHPDGTIVAPETAGTLPVRFIDCPNIESATVNGRPASLFASTD